MNKIALCCAAAPRELYEQNRFYAQYCFYLRFRDKTLTHS
ncbi:hypothetical protein L910_1462 [Vibrio fluvialis PG41]|uniref:Uncharacterized protein n=1 Tax=Vibrio fluvialis PG41 TaxID=1336752 RepID=S7HYZ8_VIBFL|nr:hypothetical protein L910_1462 [Vibrio fluvialis PG41]